MKKEIHPNYNEKVIAKCACGHSFEVGSTMEKIDVEVCSNCHPFYTGEERVIDTAGRVEKFKARREAAATIKKATKPKAKKVAEKKEEEEVAETAK